MNKVGIVVINYNQLKYIKDCLNSIAVQNYTDPMQIVVVDDASTNPKDREIIPKLVGMFRHKYGLDISFIQRETNGGANACRNTGIQFLEEVTFYTIVDADDMIPPNYIRELKNKIGNNDVCYCGVQYFGMKQGMTRPMPFHELRLRAQNFIHSANMVRYTMYKKIGKYDESQELVILEDWTIWLDICKEGGKFVTCSDTWLKYRIKSDSRNMGGYDKVHRAYAYLRKKYNGWFLG